jgi:S1-C subfamily serine protease
LFFFTGSHSDYHKPSDDYEKINLEGLKEIINFIETLTLKFSIEPKIPFTKTKTKSEGKSTSFKVTLGILPNYSSAEKGLLIDNVTEDKPAYNAGLKQGDVIIGINKCKITDIYSYMECLSKLKHGETIKIYFLRDNKKGKVKTIV